MSYESDMYAATQASEALTARIGTRFCWDVADAETPPPYVVAQTVGNDSETTLDGDRSLSFVVLQVTCWAEGKAEARAVMDVFAAELEGRALPGGAEVVLIFQGEVSDHDADFDLYASRFSYRAAVRNP